MTLTPFEQAVALTLGIEGGYANHPSDPGGATAWGITEAVARADGYAGPMTVLPKARALDIYRRLYWDRIGLQWVATVDPLVAIEGFDTGVNMGVEVAVRFLQRVLNVLNRGGRDFPDLVVDGVAGPATARALAALLRLRGTAGRDRLLAYLNALQGARYVDISEARAANEDFTYGWGARLEPVAHGPLTGNIA